MGIDNIESQKIIFSFAKNLLLFVIQILELEQQTPQHKNKLISSDKIPRFTKNKRTVQN